MSPRLPGCAAASSHSQRKLWVTRVGWGHAPAKICELQGTKPCGLFIFSAVVLPPVMPPVIVVVIGVLISDGDGNAPQPPSKGAWARNFESGQGRAARDCATTLPGPG